jgi:heptosyltransferase-1
MPRPKGPRILIIRLSAIGDVMVTTPVSRALREALPGAHLAWVVEAKARELLVGNPYLDEVIVWDRRKGAVNPGGIWQMGRELRTRRFDWAIDCQGLLRSAVLARLSGARRIVGNTRAKEAADLLYHVRVPRSTTDLSSRQRCLDLLTPLGIRSRDRRMVLPVSDADRSAGGRLLRSEGLKLARRYACLVPATTWTQKHWFEERWAELAALVRDRLGLTPVILGGPGDTAMAEAIHEGSGGECLALAGKTSLKSAAAVLQGAEVTFAVDTGLMHASVAVGTPTVGVCGASWWPGFQDYEHFVLVREPLKCSPCLHRPTCEGRYDCMQAITAERVLAAGRQAIALDPRREWSRLPVVS